MQKKFIDIATGRSRYGIVFLLIFMCIAPVAVFTHYVWLESLAWIMTIIMGIFIFITGLVTRQEAIDSVVWPISKARLITASVTYIKNGTIRRYTPFIKCEFDVNGKTYTGTNYDFSSSYTDKVDAEEKVEFVKRMKPLIVHYKPDAPEINVIKPGLHSVPYVRLVLGLLIVVVSPLIWFGVIPIN